MSDAPQTPESVSRRDFLRVGSMGVVGLKMAEQARALHPSPKPRNCILILMSGGASQLETFDPKPEAPREIRGPMRAIDTSIPRVKISESLPRIAQRLDRMTIIRSLYHEAAPIHETGLQLLQTGRLSTGRTRFPAFGSVIKQIFHESRSSEVYAVLPGPLRETGVATWIGQGAGFLGDRFEPVVPLDPEAASSAEDPGALRLRSEPDRIALKYGDHNFGRLLMQARQLIESGVNVVTVNLFDSLRGGLSFDSHAQSPESPTTIQDYVEKLCPRFDQAYSALLDDLDDRGLLKETIVVACGEFGRSPRVNFAGGRDHWTRCWSALVAGDGIPGGQVIGKTDATASEILDRPVHTSELTATLYHLLGVPRETLLRLEDNNEIPLIEANPLPELLGTSVA
ncbi:MAG TPA: DUF1501 domain-containing protein [Planctomycetaceae bacterium]|nr:DUF1501 domain-containing protein [Planctomycetaceae bacterium]